MALNFHAEKNPSIQSWNVFFPPPFLSTLYSSPNINGPYIEIDLPTAISHLIRN